MQSHTVFEPGNVVITALAGVVGYVEGDTPVQTQHKEGEVVADTYTCAQRNAVEELAGIDIATGAGFVLAHEPYVAGVEEGGTVEVTAQEVGQDAETVLYVGLELDVARLVYIRVLRVGGRMEMPWTDRTDGEGTNAVGSAHIELFVVGGDELVAV